jgi:glycerol-3-phosphate dehydrogenase subunit C
VMNEKKVIYFAGCSANYYDIDVGKHTIEVLEKNGISPIVPSQNCCGTPQLSTGDLKAFSSRANDNINSLADLGLDIVTACTSCALTLKHDYNVFLNHPKAAAMSKRVYDIMEYLTLLKKQDSLNMNFNPVNLSVFYHTPCHLKVLGEDLVKNRTDLMRSIPGLSFTRIDNECCGMGGTFGVKKNTFDISMKIGKTLFEMIGQSDADVAATDCPTCKMQIEQGTIIKAVHPISIIKKAYEN